MRPRGGRVPDDRPRPRAGRVRPEQPAPDRPDRLRAHRHLDGYRGPRGQPGPCDAHHGVRLRLRAPREHEDRGRAPLPAQDGPPQARDGLPQGAGRPRHRRRDDLHAGPLARAHGRGGLLQRQGRLRAEAHGPLRGGERGDRGGRAEDEARVPHRHAAALRQGLRCRLREGRGVRA